MAQSFKLDKEESKMQAFGTKKSSTKIKLLKVSFILKLYRQEWSKYNDIKLVFHN